MNLSKAGASDRDNAGAQEISSVALKIFSRKAALAFAGLGLLAMFLQAVPFLLFSNPGAESLSATKLPSNYPPAYSVTDYLNARALDQATFWGGIFRTTATVLALFAMLFSGLADWVGQVRASKAQAWLLRIAFLFAVFLCCRFVELPFLVCRFQQNKAFGLTSLPGTAWLKLLLLQWIVPLALFTLRYVFVICTLPLGRRFWWLAAALGLFLIGDVAPEVLSRTYPLDSVETLHPLDPGPHADQLKALLRKAHLDLPIMVADEARRSNSGQICLIGRPGREYVLVSDTFLRDYTPRQVTLALGHELGHFERRPITLLVEKTGALVLLLLSFGLVSLLTGRRALPIEAAARVVLLTILCSLLCARVLNPMSLAYTRSEERFADRHALELVGGGQELEQLLLKVAQNERDPLDIPAWRYFWSASHPTFLERIADAARWSSEKGTK
jgi:STE24 endopeptidase